MKAQDAKGLDLPLITLRSWCQGCGSQRQCYVLASGQDAVCPCYWTKLYNLWVLPALPFSQPAEKVLAFPAEKRLPPPTSPLRGPSLQNQVLGFFDAESAEWYVCMSRGRVRAGEGHALKKEGELSWRSFGGWGDRGWEELERLQGMLRGHRWREFYCVLLDWGSYLGPWPTSLWVQGGISPPFLLRSDLSWCLALTNELWTEAMCGTSVQKLLEPCVVHLALSSLPLWLWSFCWGGFQVTMTSRTPW